MKSICTKLSAVMIAFVISSAILVGAANVFTIRRVNIKNTEEILMLTSRNIAERLDSRIMLVEQSVGLLSQHAAVCFRDSDVSQEEAMEFMANTMFDAAACVENTTAVYLHFSPEYRKEWKDLLLVRDPVRQTFELSKADDPSVYRETTGNEAEWYYESADSGQPCWLAPYENGDLQGYEDRLIASYTIPVYDRYRELIGVIGMDVAMDGLIDEVKDIRLYETGYGFLVGSDVKIVYHPELAFGSTMIDYESSLQEVIDSLEDGTDEDELFSYQHNGVRKELCFSVLRNGMRVAVTVPSDEAYADFRQMMGKTSVLLMIICLTSIITVTCIVYSFIRPLRLLNQATTQIINGNMNVKIRYHSQDEIGRLADNFRKMAEYLQSHITYINQLAYRDVMTGVKNKTAYEAATQQLQQKIAQKKGEFGVVMFDLNNLKRVNDTLGHEAGDTLIKNASRVICQAFAHSPVFRIGGDEFAAILEEEDYRQYENCIETMKRLNQELNETLPKREQVFIAYGMSLYIPGEDEHYSQVAARADKEMYTKKAEMKASQGDARRERGADYDQKDTGIPAV